MMCQAYEAERNYCVGQELREIKEAWEAHKGGEKVLTDDELKDLAIRKFMLMEI